MNAAPTVAWEVKVSIEARVARVERDIEHVQSTLTEVKNDIRSLTRELEKFKIEFYSFEAKVPKNSRQSG
jgi:predicted RNase H-like nuclease (RuvC/YqgF family)